MTARRVQRAITVVAVMVSCGAVALVAPAAAHLELERSEPAAGAALEAAPPEVFLRFTDAVEEGSFTIRVLGPDGKPVTAGQTQSGGRAAAVGLQRLTDEGSYVVRYRGVAADGHPVEGRFRFRLRASAIDAATSPPDPSAQPSTPATDAAPGTAPPTAAATAPVPQRRTVPWWPFALLLGIAALVGITLFRRR